MKIMDEKEAENLLRFIEILDSVISLPALYDEKKLSKLNEEAEILGLKMKKGN